MRVLYTLQLRKKNLHDHYKDVFLDEMAIRVEKMLNSSTNKKYPVLRANLHLPHLGR